MPRRSAWIRSRISPAWRRASAAASAHAAQRNPPLRLGCEPHLRGVAPPLAHGTCGTAGDGTGRWHPRSRQCPSPPSPSVPSHRADRRSPAPRWALRSPGRPATLISALPPAPVARRRGAAHAPSQPPFDDAGYLHVADRIQRLLDVRWSERDGRYRPGADLTETMVNANLLLVHAVAAQRGHTGRRATTAALGASSAGSSTRRSGPSASRWRTSRPTHRAGSPRPAAGSSTWSSTPRSWTD